MTFFSSLYASADNSVFKRVMNDLRKSSTQPLYNARFIAPIYDDFDAFGKFFLNSIDKSIIHICANGLISEA